MIKAENEAIGSQNDEASLLSEDKNTFYKKYAKCRHHKILTQWEKTFTLFLRTLFLLKYPLKMPPIPKAMGVGDAIVTYQVSIAGGLFGPRPGALLEPQNVPQSALAAPPRHFGRPEPQGKPLLTRHRASPKVWSLGLTKMYLVAPRLDPEITGAVARERENSSWLNLVRWRQQLNPINFSKHVSQNPTSSSLKSGRSSQKRWLFEGFTKVYCHNNSLLCRV